MLKMVVRGKDQRLSGKWLDLALADPFTGQAMMVEGHHICYELTIVCLFAWHSVPDHRVLKHIL